MTCRKRISYTETQKALMWDRWRQSEFMQQIASLFDQHHSSVRNILAEHGSIRPPTRRRSARVMSLAEREEISRGLVAGRSICIMIAALLGQAPFQDLVRRPSPVSWRWIDPWPLAWQRRSSGSGRLNRSPAGSNPPVPTMRAIRCPAQSVPPAVDTHAELAHLSARVQAKPAGHRRCITGK